MDNSLLPNDQIELDRMRVLSYIMRWAFKGFVSRNKCAYLILTFILLLIKTCYSAGGRSVKKRDTSSKRGVVFFNFNNQKKAYDFFLLNLIVLILIFDRFGPGMWVSYCYCVQIYINLFLT